MSRLPRRSAFVLLVTFAVAALAPADGAAAPAAERGADRCFTATAKKRKTSLGVHQWTARLDAEWCVAERNGRTRIVSAGRETSVRTGTNWRLIWRSGEVDLDGPRRAKAEARFHFRLRYPYFEQNCYPRLALELFVDGAAERTVRTGC
jgi:hypothetical protein